MADYVELLRTDLVEQFKDKPVIDALVETIGTQLNDVGQFFEDLRDSRSIQTYKGKQLDGAGDIVVLSRTEAGALACVNKSVYVLDDESYRQYLIYKVWRNTNNCTYYDIIKALRMFWEKPLFYREDPDEPAMMVFETDTLSPEDDVAKLLNTPIIKAAGVGVKVIATTESPQRSAGIQYGGGYFSITDTQLPEYQMDYGFKAGMHLGAAFQSISQTTLPKMNDV